MSLLEDVITECNAATGITAKDGHVYKGATDSGYALVTVQPKRIILEGLGGDEVERPFQIKIYAKDQTTQDTLVAAVKTKINVAITGGYWKIYEEAPDNTESRKIITLFCKQNKVE